MSFSADTPTQPNTEEAVGLYWNNIQVTTLDGSKTLLNGISGRTRGRLTAVMGGSGAGKTTLLASLSCRVNQAKSTGEATLGGKPYTARQLKAVAGYVMQDDVLFGSLTVRQTLTYAAKLRMSPDTSAEAREARVKELIDELSLGEVQDKVIGEVGQDGAAISGGERKRVCVALELLSRPRVLFLDEPTSGLDSASSFSLVKILKGLAEAQKVTIVCTIHQPPARVFSMFDELVVLHRGSLLYHGPADEVMALYAEAGFELPLHTNPADHLLDVITGKTAEDSAQAAKNAEKLMETSARRGGPSSALDKLYPPSEKFSGDIEIPESKNRISWWKQFCTLFMRVLAISTRSKKMILAQVLQAAFIGMLVGLAFFQIGTGQVSVRKRNSLIFFAVINQGIFGALHVVTSFPLERAVVVRERQAGTYNVSAYFLAKISAESLILLLTPTTYSCVVYFISGLEADAGKFFTFLLFLNLEAMAATSLGILISAIARQVTPSLAILPLALEVSRLFGGFFLPPTKLPNYFVWLDALSYVKYTYVGLALNELHGQTYTCLDSDPKPCTLTGQQVIERNGFDFISIPGAGFAIVGLIIGFRLLAYLIIRYRK